MALLSPIFIELMPVTRVKHNENDYKEELPQIQHQHTPPPIARECSLDARCADAPLPSEDKTDDFAIEPSVRVLAKKKGYKIIRKLQDTLQGCLYQAIRIEDHSVVAIKATCKALHKSKISPCACGTNIVVEEDIISESILLRHLTSYCKPSYDHIANFIGFYESTTHYYLCMEYVGNMTLKAFVHNCHQYIKAKRLALKEYKAIAKYIFWQIAVTIHWMHQDLNCCHLDLTLDNIMVENAEFITDPNDDSHSISIHPDLNIKIIDFGLSEMFSTNNAPYDRKDPFLCLKHGMTGNQTYVSPKVYHGLPYNARCADMWSLGIILYYMSVRTEPYVYPDSDVDGGYFALKHGCLHQHIEASNGTKYVKKSLSELIVGLLNMNEKKRWTINEVLDSTYLSSYYPKYQEKIALHSQFQQRRNDLERESIKGLLITNERFFELFS